ncbi:MAG: hypothetical protein QXJ48_05745 [Candidatus Korarchaeum sp.]
MNSMLTSDGSPEAERATVPLPLILLPEELEKESKGWLLRDLEEYLTGLRKIKLMMRRPNTRLVICHDPGLWEKYPKEPKALE